MVLRKIIVIVSLLVYSYNSKLMLKSYDMYSYMIVKFCGNKMFKKIILNEVYSWKCVWECNFFFFRFFGF